MYTLYLLGFRTLHALGLKKTSVRFVRYMEKYCRRPLDNSKLYTAVWEFVGHIQKYSLCDDGRGNGCYMPVLSGHDKFHESCRQLFTAEDARIEAETDAYFANLCKQPGCWEDAVKDGYCQSDWDHNFLCSNCGKLLSDCKAACLDTEEMDDSYTDDEDGYVSTGKVYGRAYTHFGNAEMAREATEMYPGDFI